MVIKKKVQQAAIDDFIKKGGDVPEAQKKSSLKPITIRVPDKWLEKIDEAFQKKCGMTRTAWILQAAQEKLEREIGD